MRWAERAEKHTLKVPVSRLRLVQWHCRCLNLAIHGTPGANECKSNLVKIPGLHTWNTHCRRPSVNQISRRKNRLADSLYQWNSNHEHLVASKQARLLGRPIDVRSDQQAATNAWTRVLLVAAFGANGKCNAGVHQGFLCCIKLRLLEKSACPQRPFSLVSKPNTCRSATDAASNARTPTQWRCAAASHSTECS